MDSFDKEEERIRQLLKACYVGSEEADDNDLGEVDNLEVRSDSTDTKQEMNDMSSEIKGQLTLY